MLQEPHSHHHREKSVKCNLLAAKVRGQLRILWWTSCCIESRFSRTLPSGYMDRRPLQKQQSCGLRTLDNMYWRSEVLGKFTTIMCSLVEPLRTTNNLFFPISKFASAERRSLNKMSLSTIYYLYLDSLPVNHWFVVYFNELNATLSVDSPIAPPAGKENLSLNSSQQGEEI